MMKTYRLTSDEKQNAFALPLQRVDDVNSLPRFSYFTCCKLADAMHITVPTPKTIAIHCKAYGDHILRLDDSGNFQDFYKVLPAVA